MAFGALSKAAIKQGSTWGTVATPGAGNLLIIDSETIKAGEEAIDDPGIVGSAYGIPPLVGSKIVNGNMAVGARFSANTDLLWALALGAAPSPTSLGGGLYQHDIDFTDSLTKFFSLWFDKQVSVWEIDSAMVNTIAFNATLKNRFTFDVGIAGRSINLAGQSIASTTDPAPTYQPSFLNLNKATFRINGQTAAALTDANCLAISEFALNLNNALAVDDFLTATDCSAGVIAQPTRSGQIEVSGSFTLPEYTANTWRSAFSASTEYKMDLEFCGGNGYKFIFTFPRIRITEMPDNPISGEGRIANKIMFKAYEASSAPNGMTGITKPFRVSVINGNSNALLA